MQYSYSKSVNVDRLKKEIQESSIAAALDKITLEGSSLEIYFKASLSQADEATLTTIVNQHSNTAMPQENQRVEIVSMPAIADKTLPNGQKLYERVVGFQYDVSTVDGTHLKDEIYWTATFPHSKMLGVQFVNTTALDVVDFEVYDDANGTYSLILTGTSTPNAKLNQFGFSVNLPKDSYHHRANFDADVYQGMVIKITYKSSTTKKIGINFIMNEVKSE